MYCNTNAIKMREANRKNQTSKNKSPNQPTNIKKKPKHEPQPEPFFFFQF